MSYLSDWVSKLTKGHTLTADDIAVLRRVQMSLVSADKHHRQAREGQTMQELLEQEVERQTKEITALHQKVASLGRKLVDLQRDESKVHEAERVVLSRAVEFVQACAHHVFTIMEYGEGEAELHRTQLDQVEEDLVTAVADLLAAEAAA